ncbi:MAG: Alanyl-tRNA synthetase [Bacteroidetes bacterium]|nr:Alanyl-tRNA synthetase [Bacteroidota bacterium]
MAKDYDPRMHSAEHILNQTMVRMFNRGRSFSAHIEKKKSKCDYRHFERDLTEDELKEIERRVNDVIAADMQVTESFMPRAEADQLFNLDKLPDTAGDTLRIIRIGDYDACPCRGQHVHSTKEIGGFRIISTSYENGVLRVRFRVEGSGED